MGRKRSYTLHPIPVPLPSLTQIKRAKIEKGARKGDAPANDVNSRPVEDVRRRARIAREWAQAARPTGDLVNNDNNDAGLRCDEKPGAQRQHVAAPTQPGHVPRFCRESLDAVPSGTSTPPTTLATTHDGLEHIKAKLKPLMMLPPTRASCALVFEAKQQRVRKAGVGRLNRYFAPGQEAPWDECSPAIRRQAIMNQCLFHSGAFVFDEIATVLAGRRVDWEFFAAARLRVQQWHSNMQSDFLRRLEQVCSDMARADAGILDLASKVGKEADPSGTVFSHRIEPALTKKTYEDVWAYAKDVLPWDDNFAAAGYRREFLRAVWVYMTRSVLVHFADSVKNNWKTVLLDYQGMGSDSAFKAFEKADFVWRGEERASKGQCQKSDQCRGNERTGRPVFAGASPQILPPAHGNI